MKVDIVTQENLRPIIELLEQLTAPTKVAPTHRVIEIDPKMGLSVSSVAETLELSEDTIRRNIAKPASDPLLLPAFRALENATRIHFREN